MDVISFKKNQIRNVYELLLENIYFIFEIFTVIFYFKFTIKIQDMNFYI